MTKSTTESRQAYLFDLDGTLVDSVYQHVLAWREALEEGGIHLAVWRIHRQIGMSGGVVGVSDEGWSAVGHRHEWSIPECAPIARYAWSWGGGRTHHARHGAPCQTRSGSISRGG